jgi:hypothetical protein
MERPLVLLQVLVGDKEGCVSYYEAAFKRLRVSANVEISTYNFMKLSSNDLDRLETAISDP